MKLLQTSLFIATLACSAVHAQQTRLNVADMTGPGEFQYVNLKTWAEDITKATGGAVQINVHGQGSLIKNPEIKRAVQTGQVEFGTQLMQNLGPEKRLFEIDGIPFLAPGYDQGLKLWEAERPYAMSYMQKTGLRLLYAVPWPPQGFFLKKEMNSLADVKGQRQRAYNEMTSRLAQLMGTVPTTVQITELAQAMTTGTIQMFNTSTPSAAAYKAWDFSSHFYDAQAWLPKHMLFVNEEALRKLPPAHQKAILEASAVAEKRGWQMSREQTDDGRKKLVDAGMKVVVPSPALQKELDGLGQTLRNEWLLKADDDAKAVMSQYLKAAGK